MTASLKILLAAALLSPSFAHTTLAEPAASLGHVIGGHMAVTNGDGDVLWVPLRDGQPALAAPNGRSVRSSQRATTAGPSTTERFVTVTDGEGTRLVWVPSIPAADDRG